MSTAPEGLDETPRDCRFGDFVVDLAGARLLRGGEPVHLEPKVFEVLVYLIEHRDRIVGKEELVERVWEGAFITDNALTKAIARLRRALEDDPHAPRFIETSHARGYRFVGTLEEPAGVVAGAPRWRPIWLAAGILVMFSAVAFWQLGSRGVSDLASEPRPQIESLAVLPLNNLTGDPDQAYLAEGLHELLITELAALRPLRVISRQSTLQFRGGDRPIPEIAEALDVDAVIEGSVMRSESRTQVTVQLIGGRSDSHLWARTFARNDEDLLALLSEVAAAIANEVDVVLSAGQQSHLDSLGSIEPEAQELYLQARFLLSQGDPGGYPRAQRLLEEAVARDPEFALAHSGLSGVYGLSGLFGAIPRDLAREKSEAAARRALELDPWSADAHSSLGLMYLYYDWNLEAAGRELAIAIELNPNDAYIRHAYGDYLTVLGRLEEGLEQVRIGRRIAPASPLAIAPVLGHLLFLERYEEVVSEARALLATDSDFFLARPMLFRALWQLGRYEEAIEVQREEWSTSDPGAVAVLETGWEEGGPEGAMLAVANYFATRSGDDPRDALAIARYYAAGGADDRAFEYLERGLEARLPQALHVLVEPEFRSLRRDPRFEEIRSRLTPGSQQ